MRLTKYESKSDAELQELIETLSRKADSDEVRFLAWCLRRHLESKHSGQI
jgi:hypothetical protein